MPLDYAVLLQQFSQFLSFDCAAFRFVVDVEQADAVLNISKYQCYYSGSSAFTLSFG